MSHGKPVEFVLPTIKEEDNTKFLEIIRRDFPNADCGADEYDIRADAYEEWQARQAQSRAMMIRGDGWT